MSSEVQLCPEQLLWAVARALKGAVAGDSDPASRLITGLAGLIFAAETYQIGEQPEAATAVAGAAPLMAELSNPTAVVTEAGTRGAASLAIMFGQPFDEVRALMAVGLADEWADLAGLQRSKLETAWRARRLAQRYAAHQSSVALGESGPASATRH